MLRVQKDQRQLLHVLTYRSGKTAPLWGFTHLGKLLDGLLIKLNLLKVFKNTRRRTGFGNDGVTTKLGP